MKKFAEFVAESSIDYAAKHARHVKAADRANNEAARARESGDHQHADELTQSAQEHTRMAERYHQKIKA